MLRRTQQELVSAGGADEDLQALDGKSGTTLTRCRPSGMAEIEGQRVNVVAEGTMLEAGIPIKVIRIEGNRVVVRGIEEAKDV
jgi:membrane-bound serine protease (ClpP class)